jgi:hypothetical protein
MVPFSFPQPLLKSRVMKERSLPSSPLTGAKRTILPIFFISPNWVQRHAGLVGQTCRFAPIKKLPSLPRLPSKNPLEPKKPNRHPAFFIFYPCPSIGGLKNQFDFRGFKVI